MLRALHIRQLAIVEDVTVEFEPGLTVLTGETGAGKSILIDALSLALGERADRDQVRSGAEEARIEAAFDVSKQGEVAALLAELDLPPAAEGELLLRRIVSAAGKSRCAVNGAPVPLAHLARLGRILVDLHGQHEHQLLLDPATHLEFVDAFGGLLADRDAVRAAHAAWAGARAALDAARAALRGRSERLDLLEYQIDEIGGAKPEPGEDERLKAERERLAHARALEEALGRALDALSPEGGAGERLGEAVAALRGVSRHDPERVGPVLESLRRLAEMVRDESAGVRGVLDRLAADPARLATVEERLDLLERIKRKYGGSLEAALARLAEARAEAAALTSSDDAVRALEAQVAAAQAELSKRAVDLSEDRSLAAARFAESVAREIRELAMGGADFGVRLSQQGSPDGPVEWEGSRYVAGPEGIDQVEFYIAPNVGEGTRPLKAVASGGELSRIMLALKAVLAKVDRVGTLVFDEIDVGIGGRVADVVGAKLAEIGAERQVICITHLPQIAAKAGRHLVVRKEAAGGHTTVEVNEVAGTARVRELARMLAGEDVTPTALKHAEALLKGG